MKRFFLLLLFTATLASAADPTRLRVWTSTKGTKIVARAKEVLDGQVTFEKRGGKLLTVSITDLRVEDQLILKNHFEIEEDDDGGDEDEPAERPRERPELPGIDFDDIPEDGGDMRDVLPADLKVALGATRGPIKASDESSYYIYLPTTMVKGLKAPLFFWTGHHEGKAEDLKFLREGAELTGMALATSREAHYDDEYTEEKNMEHTKNCLRHIGRKLPINPKWVIFGGNDRGGASAIFNSDRFRSGGALVINSYIPEDSTASAKGSYFITCGTQNRNRYRAAHAAWRIGKYAMFLPYEGNVSFPDEEFGTNALLYLYTRHLYRQHRLRSEEASRFEKRFAPWLDSYAASNPEVGYWFCEHLLKTCDIESDFRNFVLALQARILADEPQAGRYTDGVRALRRFAEEIYAGYGGFEESLIAHTTPKIENHVERLTKEFGDVPYLGGMLSRLALPTR